MMFLPLVTIAKPLYSCRFVEQRNANSAVQSGILRYFLASRVVLWTKPRAAAGCVSARCLIGLVFGLGDVAQVPSETLCRVLVGQRSFDVARLCSGCNWAGVPCCAIEGGCACVRVVALNESGRVCRTRGRRRAMMMWLNSRDWFHEFTPDLHAISCKFTIFSLLATWTLGW